MNSPQTTTPGDSPAQSPAQSPVESPVDVRPLTPASSDHAHTESPSPILPTEPTKDTLPPLASQKDDQVTIILRYISGASPATLGAIAVVSYLVLGRLLLLLIGAVAGVTCWVIWESRHPEAARAVRGEDTYALLDRLIDPASGNSKLRLEQDTEKDAEKDAIAVLQSFDDFQPETKDALCGLVDAIVRDYVEWWYNPIVPSDHSFPLTCRKVMTRFILSFSNRLRNKRPADAFVDFVTHSCSIIIVFFSEMAAAYAKLPADTHMTAADAIYKYLASHPDAPLSNLLNKRQQAAKFRVVSEDLLGFLEKSTYDCKPAKTFLREILSTVVLEGSLQTFSRAEWINGWIVYLLESGETDLSHAIDDAIQDQKAFGDIDGNVGNIGLSKGNRNSYELDRERRKDIGHKKKLSKAEEEMEKATEEMRRLNEMIAEADRAKAGSRPTTSEASSIMSDKEDLGGKDRTSTTSVTTSDPPSSVSGAARISFEADMTEMAHYPSAPPIPLKPSSEDSHTAALPDDEQESAPIPSFTNFDQLVPPAKDEDSEEGLSSKPPFTIHDASITIHDDTTMDNNRLRSKPTWEYLLQIEPSSPHYPGWMIMKTYSQFEGLHESLRRIANISGATAFLEAHSTFPAWKLHTRSSLRGEMERYMRTACGEKSLAESEAMKRFLDKAQEPKMGVNRGFSFESVGKGVLGALQNAPKGALDGGKVVMGGVTGVFSNIGLGPKKPVNTSLQETQTTQKSSSRNPSKVRPVSLPVLPRTDTPQATNGPKIPRDSIDSQRSSIISMQPGKVAPMDRWGGSQTDGEPEITSLRPDREPISSLSGTSSRGHSRASSLAAIRSPLRSSSEISLSNLKLPPPPNEIADDYGSPTSTRVNAEVYPKVNIPFTAPPRASLDQQDRTWQKTGGAKRLVKHYTPLSEQETRVAIELFFAVINELYTLSSAWNIRRTLLAAAKSFLLRPGNPSLVSIQYLIQNTLLDANTSDDGIAAHIRKLRENSLPTEEERKAWPAELTVGEKEELRERARKLFIQSSVPAALMGVMGQSATNEALGRVFDCLQIEEIARGLFFGLMLQAVRVVTH
ncbi:hypothetical protein GGS21DRAFT_506029 [Xylaria nigripes]|nr:hypothetical protein GGS21DRAFT_506029 [Xylaria nigripes]